MRLRHAAGASLVLSVGFLFASSVAVASHAPADGASLAVGTTPVEPTSADGPTLDFRWTQPWGGVSIQAFVLPAQPCPATAAEAFARRSQPTEPPVDQWRAQPLSAARGEPSGEVRWGNLLALPPGSYVLCGYMYDGQGNPEAPYGSTREWGGHPDVAASHAFSVRSPRASVSLDVSPRSAGHRSETEKITFTAEWSAEPSFAGYAEDDITPLWSGGNGGPELGVMFYRDQGALGEDQCPGGPAVEDVRSRSFLSFSGGVGSDDTQAGPLLDEEARSAPWVASGTQTRKYPLYVTSYGSVLNDLAPSPGSYFLCAYVFRYRDTAVNPAVFPEATSRPVLFEVTGSGTGGSNGDRGSGRGGRTGPGSAACKRAKTSLRKAKSTLKKARRQRASRRKIKKLSAKVKRTRTRVKKVC